MGIKNLKNFLRKEAPNSFREISLSEYAYKKVAIDTSLFIFKYKSVCGSKWVLAFLGLVCALRKNNIHFVFVFDGKNPVEKEVEKQKRQNQRDIRDDKIAELEMALEQYHQEGVVNELLMKISAKHTNEKLNRLLKRETNVLNIKFCEKELEKMKSQVIGITTDDISIIKEMFDILQIPFLQSETEGETLCSYLCVRGIVDAVLSEDSDVLAYGVNKFLTQINTYSMTCEEIDYQKVLESLNFSKEQFLDLCIMCGCDYNENIKKIGVKNSFKLLKTHKSIEKIKEETTLDTSPLNHVRVRELFSVPDKINLDIPLCGMPDFNRLQRFLLENNYLFDVEKIKDAFSAKLVFE